MSVDRNETGTENLNGDGRFLVLRSQTSHLCSGSESPQVLNHNSKTHFQEVSLVKDCIYRRWSCETLKCVHFKETKFLLLWFVDILSFNYGCSFTFVPSILLKYSRRKMWKKKYKIFFSCCIRFTNRFRLTSVSKFTKLTSLWGSRREYQILS